MVAIDHEIKIKASPEHVFAQLATVEGLRSWYGTQISGGTDVQNVLEFHFACRPDSSTTTFNPKYVKPSSR
jgi:hypothetical protein